MSIQDKKYTFALDIGTRSVIGIVGRKNGELFEVVDTEKIQHTRRSMVDGQIEDIEQVAKIAGLVKSQLEQRLDTTFTDVCVAAAGRALKTKHADFEIELTPTESIVNQILYQLEMGAIGKAQEEIFNENPIADLFCVGYSVVKYLLDDYPMATILGHKGKKAKVTVIATFLPNEVIDSLRSAMSMIGLNISNLTLEPIAAMNAVIPAELRLLNLALVDIGAGTSDIAISREGSVAAYTMATIAGDEISEAIIRHFLVDFQTAERIKSEATKGINPISYTDIIGFEYSMSLEQFLEVIKPAVEQLARVICEKIVECNEKSPSAVFLVGGGSKIITLAQKIAEILDIDVKKVAVGGNNYMKRQTTGDIDLSDPEYATPVGIALTASALDGQEGFYVFLNGKKINMFRQTGLTVMDTLIMSGYKYNQMMGRGGKGLTFELNGDKKIIRGGLPKPAQILINGVSANISTSVKCADKLAFVPAISGEDANITISELIEQKSCTVTLAGTPHNLTTMVLVNGIPAPPEYQIKTLDIVNVVSIDTIEKLCNQVGLEIDGKNFFIDGEIVEVDSKIYDNNIITWTAIVPSQTPQIDDISKTEQTPPLPIKSSLNIQPESLTPPPIKRSLGILNITLNGNSVELYPKADNTPYLFVDMLNFVDIDPTNPQGNITLKINGEEASYLQVVNDSDNVQIYWSDRIII